MQDILDDFSESPAKSRHGCVVAWLWFCIIGSILAAFLYILGGEFMNLIMEESGAQSMSKMTMMAFAIISIVSIVGYYMIMQWKKIGFYIVSGLSVLSGLVNYSVTNDMTAIIGAFLGPIILFAILQIRKDGYTAWDHLE